jgi:4-amino-4-deoxy-L-arabinose transferase-like glycosyltransferase
MNSEFDKENSSLRDGRYLNRSTILMFCVLFAGLFLRIYDLAGESFWLDEGISIQSSKLSLISIVFELIPDVHPPLYLFILHYWVGLFGDSEFSARFLSVIFGFSSLIVIYRLGTLICSKNIGILSSFLLSFSVFHIRFSQEVRGYSLMVFLTLLSLYFFIRLRDGKDRKIVWGYILSSSALMFTHYYGLLIILAQNIYMFTLYLLKKNMYEPSTARWWRLQVVLGILYLPWLFILLNQVISIQDGFWIPQPSLKALLDTFIKYAGSRQTFLLFSALTVIGLIPSLFFRTRRQTGEKADKKYSSNLSPYKSISLLTVWMLTPILLPFVVSQVSAPIYETRYTIAASLPFYILAARGIEQLTFKYLKLGIILIIIIFSLGNIQEYFTKIDKQQWREAAFFIERHAKKDDVVLLSPDYTLKKIFNYYSKRSDLNKKPIKIESKEMNEEEKRNFGSVVKGYDVVWLVTSFGVDSDGLKIVLQHMGYNMLYQIRYDGSGALAKWSVIEIHLFRRQAG